MLCMKVDGSKLCIKLTALHCCNIRYMYASHWKTVHTKEEQSEKVDFGLPKVISCGVKRQGIPLCASW